MTMESLSNFQEINIQKYLEVLQRRWLPLIGIFDIAVTLGCLYAYSALFQEILMIVNQSDIAPFMDFNNK